MLYIEHTKGFQQRKNKNLISIYSDIEHINDLHMKSPSLDELKQLVEYRAY